jgi:hypothetical protein
MKDKVYDRHIHYQVSSRPIFSAADQSVKEAVSSSQPNSMIIPRLVMLSLKSLICSNLRKRVEKGMKVLIELLKQEDAAMHANAASEAGIIEDVIAAMDKPFSEEGKSKLQTCGWDIFSRIDQCSVQSDMEQLYRNRIVYACMSLTPELTPVLSRWASPYGHVSRAQDLRPH